VTLRASGWRQSHLGRLVVLEGLGVGIFGSVLEAAAGTSLAALVGASAGRIALAAVIAAVAGVAVALVASLIPASLISRLAPPAVLAEE
jgi:ABC-type antimicrobial peptide transport system permease subunit